MRNAKRIIVAGSRDFRDFDYLERSLIRLYENDMAASDYSEPTLVIVSGTAKGADTLGEQFAHRHGLPLQTYPAQWNRYGRSAGYRRNAEMAEVGDELVAFWNGTSPGTKSMIGLMVQRHKPVHIFGFSGG